MTTDVMSQARAVESASPQSRACLNCAATMAPDQRYCGACGQRVIHGRLTFAEIGHDFFHALTHADRSIFALIASLLLRPGHVARDYIEGRRKRHFGPFAFVVISVGVATFLSYVAGLQWFAEIPNETARSILTRHFNLVILVQMPLLAVACQLLFYNEKLHFAEHLVLAAYATGMRALFLAFIGTPLRYLFGDGDSGNWAAAVHFGVWFSYFGFAASQFYHGNRWWSAARAAFGALLTVVFTSIMIWFLLVLLAGNGVS
jgi:hypothetical protein